MEEESGRKSRRLQGLPPEYGRYIPPPRKNRKITMPDGSTETKPEIGSRLYQQIRQPSSFAGEAGQDPTKWLKEYERVAKFNRWDDMECLANAYFFLDGTSKQWFENNEDELCSWEKFQEGLKQAFGDTRHHVQQAEALLKCRAQKQGESTQSYIQNVLALCHQVNSRMEEKEKVSHLMKGVAEEVYAALLAKDIATADDFIKQCQHIEDQHKRRVAQRKYQRLPNVVSMAPIDENADLASMIRQIVQEEVQKLTRNLQDQQPQYQSLENVIREEVESVLASVSRTPQPSTWNQKRQYAYQPNNVRRPERTIEPATRKTDLWRTEDNRPVCFHCGRPGHVVRYCRERRSVFDTYRNERGNNFRRQPTPTPSADSYQRPTDDYLRPNTRTSSPLTNRGRSPTRRFRSPSPYRTSSRSPSRRVEEN